MRARIHICVQILCVRKRKKLFVKLFVALHVWWYILNIYILDWERERVIKLSG